MSLYDLYPDEEKEEEDVSGYDSLDSMEVDATNEEAVPTAFQTLNNLQAGPSAKSDYGYAGAEARLQGRGKSYEEQIPYEPSWWEKLVNPSGARKAYVNEAQAYNARQQQINASKSAEDTRLAAAEANLYKAIYNTPAGQRKPIVQSLKRLYKNQGFEMEPEVEDHLNKSEQADLEAGEAAVGLIADEMHIPREKAAKLAMGSHAGSIKWMEAKARIQKLSAQGREANAIADILADTSGDTSQAPRMPQVGTSPMPQGNPIPQGTSGTLPAPQAPTAPSTGSEGKRAAMRATTEAAARAEAKRQGIDPDLVVAFLRQENNGPFEYGDKGDAAGHFQLHEPAAIDAGKILGIDPELRHTPEGNIKLGVAYVGEVLKRAGGSPAGAAALYNWGTPNFIGKGNPKYVRNAMAEYTRLRQTPQGQNQAQGQVQGTGTLPRPGSESTANVQSEEAQAVATLQTKIDQLQQKIERLPAGAAAVPQLKGLITSLQDRQKFYITQQERIEKRYEQKPSQAVIDAALELYPGTPWVNLSGGQKQGAVTYAREVKEASDIRIQEAQGVGAVDRKPLTKEELRSYGQTAGTSHGTLRQKQQAGEKIEPLDELPVPQQTAAIGMRTVHRMTGDLMQQLDDPDKLKALAPVIGTLLSDPVAWYQRVVEGKVEGLTPDQQEFAASLGLQMVKLRKEFLGTAQSKPELEAAKEFLASLGAVTPANIRAKLKSIRSYARLEHNEIMKGAKELGQRTLSLLEEDKPKEEAVRNPAEAPALPPIKTESGPKKSPAGVSLTTDFWKKDK